MADLDVLTLDMDLSSPFEAGVETNSNVVAGSKLLNEYRRLLDRDNQRKKLAQQALEQQAAEQEAVEEDTENMDTFRQLEGDAERQLGEDTDIPEPPKTYCYLSTPTFEKPAGLPDDDDLVCRLRSACRAEAVTDVELTQQALVGGWITTMYSSGGVVSSSVCQWLFRLMAYSQDTQVSLCAYQTLAQLLRGFPAGASAHMGLLHGHHVSPVTFEWLPSDSDFLAVVKSHGYSAATPLRQLNKADDKKDNPRQPQLRNLHLTLKALVDLTAQLDTVVKNTGGTFSSPATEQLISAAVHLKLDPQAQVMYQDLSAAALGLINAMDESDWNKRFWNIAVDVAGTGPSHRAAAQIITDLPRSCPRVSMLQQHAAKILLEKLVTEEAMQGKRNSKDPEPVRMQSVRKRASVEPLDAPAVVSGLPWLNTAARTVVEGCFAAKHYTCWELRTAIELTDLLMSPLANIDSMDEAAENTLAKLKHQLKAIEHSNCMKARDLPVLQIRLFVNYLHTVKYADKLMSV